MSTFDGVIREIPGIRVDFFRGLADDPPLACFLSHVHSDHLVGLDTYKGRPVYCSAATRAMLLRLQRKAARIKLAQGILEAEEITYRHQKNRLKSLPLNTPTDIELEPNRTIRVTLFDANHCPGAVMFLFEADSKAVLYTGDIRSEPWHVESLIRNPCMVEYSSGLNVLDKVYLDTTFTEDLPFKTKRQGLQELLHRISKYPKNTIFYFSAWTYGYEEVWIALAKSLNTQIHVDDYRMKVYESLRTKVGDKYVHLSPEAPYLTGFFNGNHFQPGILTTNPAVRMHSCEKAAGCCVMDKIAPDGVVWITPIVTHIPRKVGMLDVGVGGGAHDLVDKNEVVLTSEDLRFWVDRAGMNDQPSHDAASRLRGFLSLSLRTEHPLAPPLVDRNASAEKDKPDRVYRSLAAASERGRGKTSPGSLPNQIKFAYSRHSSYPELCHLISSLKPKDVWPCTIDTLHWIKQGITIKSLFGEYCSGDAFDHDKHLDAISADFQVENVQVSESQTSNEVQWHSSGLDNNIIPVSPNLISIRSAQDNSSSSHSAYCEDRDEAAGQWKQSPSIVLDESDLRHRQISVLRNHLGRANRPTLTSFDNDAVAAVAAVAASKISGEELIIANEHDGHLLNSQKTSVSFRALETRRNAFDSTLRGQWQGLLCTTNNHTQTEEELGEG